MSDPATRGPVDMHVHLVGNGRNGSGNWMRLSPVRKLMGRAMLRGIGLRGTIADEDFDDRYAAYVAALVKASSLSHAVILAHEEVYSEDGRKLNFGSFHVTNDWVLEISKRHPELLPAVSIHPARHDALQELDRCIEGGAAMLKLLPTSQNVDCSKTRYRDFFRLMADAKLPFLAHTGGEYTVPVYDRKLYSPQRLRLPLECGVTVIAAHAATRSGPPMIERNEMPGFLQMLREYPHLYADNSALNTPNRSHGLATCLGPAVQDRIVHGSDFPVPVSGRWARMRKLITEADAAAATQETNLIERDYLLKKAMGFSDEVFKGIWRLLRR